MQYACHSGLGGVAVIQVVGFLDTDKLEVAVAGRFVYNARHLPERGRIDVIHGKEIILPLPAFY